MTTAVQRLDTTPNGGHKTPTYRAKVDGFWFTVQRFRLSAIDVNLESTNREPLNQPRKATCSVDSPRRQERDGVRPADAGRWSLDWSWVAGNARLGHSDDVTRRGTRSRAPTGPISSRSSQEPATMGSREMQHLRIDSKSDRRYGIENRRRSAHLRSVHRYSVHLRWKFRPLAIVSAGCPPLEVSHSRLTHERTGLMRRLTAVDWSRDRWRQRQSPRTGSRPSAAMPSNDNSPTVTGQ